MDTYTSPQGVTFTMDTAERYTFEQARDRLHRDMGRKWGAYALYHAGMDGTCTVGGTMVTRVGALFTITDAPTEAEALRQHLRTTGAHTRYLVAADLASMTLAELIREHDDMPVTTDSCRDCPSKYR